MSDTEEQKQNYLRENILDKGYEAEDFVTYLTSKKGDEGMNLMNWSLEELKSVVQEYIQNNPLNDKNESENTINQPNNDLQNNLVTNPILAQNINNLNNLNLNIPPGMNPYPNILLTNEMLKNNMINVNNMNLDPNLLNLQNSNLTNDINSGNVFLPKTDNPLVNSQGEQTDIYGITNTETIYCSFLEKNELSKHDNIKIEIALGEKMPGTFFSKAYQTYVITVPKLNLKVIRRYSDFEWLRQILVNIFSSSVIPPIPKKNKLGGDRFNEEFLEKRTRTLEKFLNLLNKDPIIKSSQLFYNFLSIDELKTFYEMKKQYNHYKLPQTLKPQNLKEYKSLNGQLDIKVDDSREIFYQNIKDQTEINQELLSKLNKQFKLLYNEMNMVVLRLEEISKNCEELFLHSVKYNSSDDIKRSYYELNEMFKHWSSALKKQNSLTYINIREHFKFSKNVFKSMKELINSADNCKQAYYKSKRNLISKKEDLFRKGDITKWDIGPNKNINTQDKTVALPNMLVNETNSVINLKQIYGYYLNSVNNEFERLEKIFAFGHQQNLIENSKKQITIISELFKNISDIAVASPKYSVDNIMKEVNTILNKNG